MKNNLLANIMSSGIQTKKAGQIWYSSDLKMEFLITDASVVNELHIVRAMVVSPITELGDNKDVVFKTTAKRVALRLTQGAYPENMLNLYHGEIKKEILEKVLENENAPFEDDLEFLEEIASEYERINNKLQPFREEAFTLFESEQTKQHSPVIFELPKSVKTANVNFYVPNKLAAANIDTLRKEQEFWDLERKASESTLYILNDKNLVVRLTLLENHLFFIVYSDTVKKISDIVLLNEKTQNVIKPDPPTIDITKDQRGFAQFAISDISIGTWTLSFTAGKKKYNKKIELTWKK